MCSCVRSRARRTAECFHRASPQIQRKQILNCGGMSIPYLNLRAVGKSKKEERRLPAKRREPRHLPKRKLFLASDSNRFVSPPVRALTHAHNDNKVCKQVSSIRIAIRKCVAVKRACKFANLNGSDGQAKRHVSPNAQKICDRSRLAAGIHGRALVQFLSTSLIGDPSCLLSGFAVPAMISSSSPSQFPVHR